MRGKPSITEKILLKVTLILLGLCVLFTLISIWLPNNLHSLISNFRGTATVFGILTIISAGVYFIMLMIRYTD